MAGYGGMLTVYMLIELSVLSSFIVFAGNQAAWYSQCEMVDGVTITGYFTPIEAEYASEPTVTVTTDTGRTTFRKAFWDDVNIEWAGISLNKGVLGLWQADRDPELEVHTHLPRPLDAQGGALQTFSRLQPFTPGTAASNNLPAGTILRVRTNPATPLWLEPLYQVTDTIGGPHDDTHVDLYMGEGLQAKAATYPVTRLAGTGSICVYQS